MSNYYLSIIILLLNCALQERPRADAGLDQGTVLPFMLVLLQTNRKGPVETSNSEAHITSPTTYLPDLPYPPTTSPTSTTFRPLLLLPPGFIPTHTATLTPPPSSLKLFAVGPLRAFDRLQPNPPPVALSHIGPRTSPDLARAPSCTLTSHAHRDHCHRPALSNTFLAVS